MDEISTLPRTASRMEYVPSAAFLHNGLGNGANHAMPFWMQLVQKPKPSKANTRSFYEVLAEEEKHNEPSPSQKDFDARNVAAYYMELSAP
jgi:hypothetical protein